MNWKKIKTLFCTHMSAIKFTLSSVFSAVVDLGVFGLLSSLFSWLKLPIPEIFVATVLARICSSIVNFWLNRKFSFESKQSAGGEALRYSILFVGKMCASGWLVTIFAWVPLPNVVLKAIVDTILFFFSYIIQKNWVFAKKEK